MICFIIDETADCFLGCETSENSAKPRDVEFMVLDNHQKQSKYQILMSLKPRIFFGILL